MMLMGSSEAAMCRAFFSTLAGGAQRWFTNLPSGSIGSFHELAMKFITCFMRGRRSKKHFTHLASLKQGKDETLMEFLVHWRTEEAEVDDMDDRSGIAMFISALRAGDLYKSLRRKTPRTYTSLMIKANRYAEAEEANRLKYLEEEGSKRSRTEGSSKSEGSMTSHPRRGREEGKTNTGNKSQAGSRMPPWAPAPPSDRTPHLVPFTPLRDPPNDILAYAEECHMVRTPDPRPDPPGVDMSKYCKYHRCHGHNTNDCQAWKKEIERLIQAGKLGNFIDWDRMARRDTRGRGATPQIQQNGKEKDRDESNRPVINVIFGGEALGEQAFVGAVDDRPTTKKPRREPIWFSDKDLPASSTAPKDALVISMVVNGAWVKKR
ncbi:uncharacterized protein LOC115995836 [Ipomoea triloba]|uniref:uncharacterized protein LOC115995836 n=1 Tax=Ipomoea triloba TaxID=35885 RepID=UPI00125DB443|nr:uncharacterized protein LOC115995836 [Ipomoea triloba]